MDYTKFTMGEVNVRIMPQKPDRYDILQVTDTHIHMDADLHSSDDFMALAMGVDALRRMYPRRDVTLRLPYVPYGRQDRVINAGEAFGIRVFAKLLNSLGFSEVTIWDPHSDVTSALIDNVVVIPQDVLFEACYGKGRPASIIAPDAGAIKKAGILADSLQTELIVASKKRNTVDGSLSAPNIDIGALLSAQHPLVIVDDICDGGRTFINLAKTIRHHVGNTRTLDLYVTHGIFSYGLAPLLSDGLINHIYVANLIDKTIESPNLTTGV